MVGLRRISTALVAVTLGATGLVLGAAAPAGALGNTLRVPSQFPTIQKAIDMATAPATTILVSPGTYQESIAINRSGITVRGLPTQGNPVIVEPPESDGGETLAAVVEGEDRCIEQFTNETDGFCILPSDPSSGATIKNTEISGLTIRNFADGMGILGVLTDGLNIHNNTVLNNGEYGIARFNSSHTQIVNNWVVGSNDPEHPSEAGIYVGDSPNATTLVRGNTSSSNEFGIFLRDSAHGTVTENTAIENCVGIMMLNTPDDPSQPPPSPVFDWTLVHNTADNNTHACPEGEGPPLSGIGIAVVGVTNSRLTANHATGNTPSGFTPWEGGIVVLSGKTLFGPVGVDEGFLQIDNNNLNTNDPSPDIFWDGHGQSVKFAHNNCVSSDPNGLCT